MAATIHIDLNGPKCWICGKEPAATTSKKQKEGAGLRCYVALLKLGWRPTDGPPDRYIAQLQAKKKKGGKT